MSALLASPATSRTPGPIRVARASKRSRTALREAGETPAAAYEDLHHAIMLAKESAQEVPCLGADADDWVSDDYERQLSAADRCLDCPMSVFAQCQRYADVTRPEGGTWAGITSDPVRKPKLVTPKVTLPENLCRKGLHDLTLPGATRGPTRKCVECRRVASRLRPRKPAPPPVARDCRCGCGGRTRGGRYLPGHDSQHLGRLLATVRAGEMTLEAALLELQENPRIQVKLRLWLGA